MTYAKRHKQQVSLLACIARRCSSCGLDTSAKKKRHARRNRQQRNPFFRFLQHYRAQQRGKMSAYKSSAKAAKIWNRMTIKQKCPYIEAALAASYVYKSRNNNVNRILQLLHYVLPPDEENIRPEYLPCAVKALREWQYEQLAKLF